MAPSGSGAKRHVRPASPKVSSNSAPAKTSRAVRQLKIREDAKAANTTVVRRRLFLAGMRAVRSAPTTPLNKAKIRFIIFSSSSPLLQEQQIRRGSLSQG